DRLFLRQYSDSLGSGCEQWVVEEYPVVLLETFLKVLCSLDSLLCESWRQVASDSAWYKIGVCDSGPRQLLCEVDEQFSISKGPHEHRGVAQEYAVNGEPVEMTHYPVHLVQESSEVLSSQRDFNSLNLLDRSHPRMVEVRSVNDRRSLNDGYALDDISKLNNLLDTPMDIARIRCNIDNNVSVHL